MKRMVSIFAFNVSLRRYIEDVTFSASGSSVSVATSSSKDLSLESGRDILLTPGSAKAIKLTGNVVSAFYTVGATNSGVSVPDGTTTCIITSGAGLSAAFALSFAGSSTVDGQLLFIRNDSTQDSTGIVVSQGAGALFVASSGSFKRIMSGS